MAYKKINSSDYVTNLIQDNTDQAFNDVFNSDIIKGNLLKGLNLTAGSPNAVAHKLGVKPSFWVVSRNNSNATVWESDGTATDQFLYLNVSANCKVTLWVG